MTLFFLPLSVFLPTMHRFTCKLLSVVCGECTKFKHINKHFNFQIVSSLYSWACFNSLSSHHVLPNPQDLSLAARRTVQVLMYNHAWSLLCYFQILMTFVERRKQDAKPRAWILSSVKAAAGTQVGESWGLLSLWLLVEDPAHGSPPSQDADGCWHSLWERAEPRLSVVTSCSCPWPSSCTSLGATGAGLVCSLCWLRAQSL